MTVSPSAAKHALLELKSATLNFKGTGEVTVHFKEALPAPHGPAFMDTHQQKYTQQKPDEAQSSQEIPMAVTAKLDLRKYDPKHQKELLRKFPQYRRDSHTLQIDGSFEDVAQFHKELNEALGKPVTATSNLTASNDLMDTSAAPLRVPVFQYWHLNNLQSKEIKRIEKNNGVNIKTDVWISFEEADATNTQACVAASQEFTDLFQTHATDIISVPVPGGYESVKNFVSLDPKLTLQMSSGTWSLIGPRASVNTVQKQWNPTTSLDESNPKRSEGRPLDPLPNNNLPAGSRWGGPKDIEMDIKDPLKTNGLCISHIHWELMKKAFEKQMKDIKNKFAVDIQETTIHGNVTVRARSTTGVQIAYLEMNALRALMSLYQKVVMSVMSCPLQNKSHNQEDCVKKHLDDVKKQHPSLAVMDEISSDGAWELVGLRDHLCFAISEIEEKLHGSAFDPQHKEMIGYEQTTAKFMGPFTLGSESGIAVGYKDDKWVKDTAFGGVHLDGFGQQRGADWGYESHERDRRQQGCSVDSPSNSFFEGNGQKPGEARGMESGGYRMSGDGEKRGGSGEARHDDPRAHIAGKDGGGPAEEENCPICMDVFTDKEKLSCGHGFCKDCLRQSVESLGATCPVCKKVFGKIEGDQPFGTMTHRIDKYTLPGFKRCNTIVIDYNIPSGTQSSRHPKPGRPFQGAHRTAYLPDNNEGREVLALLKRAFDQKLIFTVGTSRTSGQDDCVTWNDVHHKTSTSGGPQSFGYPDDDYLNRVKDELKAKGITTLEKVKKKTLEQILERQRNLVHLRHDVTSHEESTDRSVKHSVKIFSELLKFISSKGTEVNEMIKDQQGAAVSRAEPVIKCLELEIKSIAGNDGDGSAEYEVCPICMDEFTDKDKLSCGHAFCKDCLRQAVESLGASCPVCKKVFGRIEGDQPCGTMVHRIQRFPLPGFKRCDTIVIDYNIPSGTQSHKHPKPGRPFQGAHRTAYLPDNKEGREVLALLKRAFDQRLIFTVGTSRTNGMDDMVTWSDIHHKTCTTGGKQSFGYPDDDYLNRVKDELKAKGIE
ncbi:uncharacterized protein LOC134463478 [Engraulis encrasicolus]|uniref:uncharacterized protein LOC134463478 n=1 Tax=Engraulis encrasicolus TaxID=184585 RepID=UPI002FD5116E